MKVFKATQSQYNLLNGYQKGNNLLQFFKDANDNWVLSCNVVDDPAFAEIKQELNALPKINFNPKKIML
jgi:hypothetical protein